MSTPHPPVLVLWVLLGCLTTSGLVGYWIGRDSGKAVGLATGKALGRAEIRAERPTVGEVRDILILCSYSGSSRSAYISIGAGGAVQLQDSERLWFISGGGLREMLAQINAHTEWRCQVPE